MPAETEDVVVHHSDGAVCGSVLASAARATPDEPNVTRRDATKTLAQRARDRHCAEQIKM